MENAKNTKNAKKFSCDSCYFYCRKQSDWNRHISTQKHLLAINGNILENKKTPKEIQYNICNICNKKFKSYSGLWKHKNKCNTANTANTANTEEKIDLLLNQHIDMKTLIIELVKSNHDLQHQMVEVCKNSNNNNNNNNNSSINNSHNKTFNLQVFLNEDCKDAMNLSEFVNSLQLQLSDLDNMGKLGYTEGISKIILTEMNDLEQTKRPVHCSDIKRETLYVKDEDKWEKEQPDHPKLNKAIRKIEQKNFRLMGEWQAEHPTYMESTSEENNEFLKLISQTVNGTPENINKVIKKIAKEVVINK